MSKSVTFSVGWSNYLLTIAIIAIRAFQPNAQPLNEWSALSWFFMLMPVIWPFVLIAIVYILKGVVYLLDHKSRTI